jgi:peptide deformylase
LQIIRYPHPTLRYRAKPVRRVDRDLHAIIARMFDLMYEHEGVGLAANQVDLPLQLFVVNESGQRGEGQERVFINPVITSPKGRDEAEEGCLSLPSLNATVIRPSSVHVTAYDQQGNEINEVIDGFLARVLQHEFDHLQGVLFIDRLPESTLQQLGPDLEAFEIEFRADQQAGRILPDAEIIKRLKDIEERYC